MARRFASTAVTRIERHPGGHIHDSWMVETADADFLLQRLNSSVFPDCVRMAENVTRVATHLGAVARRTGRSDPERRSVTLLSTVDGDPLAYDPEGRPWRAFRRIRGAASAAPVTGQEAAREVGAAFGRFLAEVQDLPGPPLEEPIPGFKDFRRRLEDFETVVAADPIRRVATCRQEIEGVRRHHRVVDALDGALASGTLRRRVVHNDAKAANVLVDASSGEALCVVDLDTVAPGTVLYDIGDILRSATVTQAEDGGEDVAVRDSLLEAALAGYLTAAGDLLSPGEKELIPLAGPLMAYESALRFLTDHLVGDTYFRTDRPRHNLERARTQLRVLEALDRAGDRVAAIVASA